MKSVFPNKQDPTGAPTAFDRQIEDSRLKIDQWKCEVEELKKEDDINVCDDDNEDMSED